MNLWKKEYRWELCVFVMDYHSGQWSRGYRILSKLRPSNFTENLCEELRDTDAYVELVERYANKV